jgi:transposase
VNFQATAVIVHEVHRPGLVRPRRVAQVNWNPSFDRSWSETTLAKDFASIPGIGAITASAIVAAIGDGRMFRSERDFAAWLGLVPRQHSTGGRSTLLGISKGGNAYIRTLLVHGSRCMLLFFKDPDKAIGRWAVA